MEKFALFTPFQTIYDRFLAKITDDLYLELTPEDTYKDLETLLLSAIPGFEFPRFPIFNYQIAVELVDNNGTPVRGAFGSDLTLEEIDIISDLMIIQWLGRQIASVENTRMKYSGSDFKFTSQANHLDKLLKMRTNYEAQNKHKQRLYKRRKINMDNGNIESNWGGLAGGATSRGK